MNGIYYTINNPFKHAAFKIWFNENNLSSCTVLEPFAGSNNIISLLKEEVTFADFKSYDINPTHSCVEKRDTIRNFPDGFEVCITNPPYLAKNSAKRMGLDVDMNDYVDLYLLCLEKMLDNVAFVAAIIPESFITNPFFKSRLNHIISLNYKMFDDTDCPVCLALWEPQEGNDYKFWIGDDFIGYSKELVFNFKINKNILNNTKIKFNDIHGRLGLVAIDDTKHNNIHFCKAESIDINTIKVSSRSKTIISINDSNINIEKLIKYLNKTIENYRKKTNDLTLTSFKGLRRDGKYRRRLDFSTAKNIILHCLTLYKEDLYV